jgi:hypothetical protein
MPSDAAIAALPEGAFVGRLAFQAGLRAGLAAAAQQNWRELVLADPDFADWPLGERATIEALQAWSAAGRSLVLLAQHFDVFGREHARFVQWRRLSSHVVDARQCRGPGLPAVPSALLAPGWYLERIDLVHGRGVCSRAPEARRALRERVDECLRHSRAAFSASVAGL